MSDNSNNGGCITFALGLIGIMMAFFTVIYIVQMIVRTVVYIFNSILAFFGNILIYLGTTLATLALGAVNFALYLLSALAAIAPSLLVSILMYVLIKQMLAWFNHHEIKISIGWQYLWLAVSSGIGLGLGYMLGFSQILLASTLTAIFLPPLCGQCYLFIRARLTTT